MGNRAETTPAGDRDVAGAEREQICRQYARVVRGDRVDGDEVIGHGQ